MKSTKVVNQQILKDGKIVLYQLADRPKKLWLCRIKVPKGNGYVYRGTGTSDLYEARKFAEDLLDEFLLKLKLGQSITGHNLGKMVEEYETHIRAKGEPTQREKAILAFLKTYVGGSLRDVQALARHSSIAMTQRYIEVSEDCLQAGCWIEKAPLIFSERSPYITLDQILLDFVEVCSMLERSN